MQASAIVNLPERVTLSMKKLTQGSILNNVRNSTLAPPTNLPCIGWGAIGGGLHRWGSDVLPSVMRYKQAVA